MQLLFRSHRTDPADIRVRKHWESQQIARSRSDSPPNTAFLSTLRRILRGPLIELVEIETLTALPNKITIDEQFRKESPRTFVEPDADWIIQKAQAWKCFFGKRSQLRHYRRRRGRSLFAKNTFDTTIPLQKEGGSEKDIRVKNVRAKVRPPCHWVLHRALVHCTWPPHCDSLVPSSLPSTRRADNMWQRRVS